MRNLVSIAAVGVLCSAVSAFGGKNQGGGNSSAPAARHSSSAASTATAVSPRLSGMQHHSGQASMSYRPTTTYRNGNRTLNYPAVKASSLNRVSHSNVTTFKNANNARLIPRGARTLQTSNGDSPRNLGKFANNGTFRRSVGNVQRSDSLDRSAGNLQRSGKLQHAGALNLNGKNKLDPQTSARLRHWNGNVSSSHQAHQNHWNNCHHHHNHHWWRNRCVTIIFWNWGWWGWYDGWWYPAWGYDPYSYYDYNEPIYGYGDSSPEQIIASVQVALQQQGYYQYAIDGQMGPMTREAIARYQSDHRLPITYGIDPATLGSLGVIH